MNFWDILMKSLNCRQTKWRHFRKNQIHCIDDHDEVTLSLNVWVTSFEQRSNKYWLNYTEWAKKCDPNVWAYWGLIINTMNVIFTDMSFFCQPFQDFTKKHKIDLLLFIFVILEHLWSVNNIHSFCNVFGESSSTNPEKRGSPTFQMAEISSITGTFMM